MRKLRFEKGSRYHLRNSGSGGQLIFQSDADRARFLFLLIYFQGERSMRHVTEQAARLQRAGTFRIRKSTEADIISRRNVELMAFTLMPGYFELLVEARSAAGVSEYMHAVQVAYTKYFNARYRREGHLFRGPFTALPVADAKCALYLSAHLHRKVRELPEWRSRTLEYPFASYGDYVQKNRFGELLRPETILSSLPSGTEYRKFVEHASGKELASVLPAAHFFK